MSARRTPIGALVAALVAGCTPTLAGAAESPPAQGTRLHFQRTLSVHSTTARKVYAETRRVSAETDLWQILALEYGLAEEAFPPFVEAFRSLNPGVDPERLSPGQVVRVPFKLEEAPSAAGRPVDEYTVQPGDSLWKILKNRYLVPRERMEEALAAVAVANPDIVDLNVLYVGQRVVVPAGLTGSPAVVEETQSGPPPFHRDVLSLLEELGCEVSDTGETFLPLGRGRTARLDGKDFPLVSGPTGKKVLLDPMGRMSPALARSIEQAWDYRVVAGAAPDAESQLGRLLPLLGFHEVSEGMRTIFLDRGVELLALARWTVVARPEDLWEGQLHLFFRSGSELDPNLVGAATRAGFALHSLGSASAVPPSWDVPVLAQLSMPDVGAGLAQLLSLLGIAHQVRPEIDCELAGGIRYRLRPQLTFRQGALSYAVPPSVPAKAGLILSRSGYFTISWPPGASPLNQLADVLALLGVPHARTTVEAPRGQALRIRAAGIVLQDPKLTRTLYPSQPAGAADPKVFLTTARLTESTAGGLFEEGLFPWIVRTDR